MLSNLALLSPKAKKYLSTEKNYSIKTLLGKDCVVEKTTKFLNEIEIFEEI